MDLKSSAKKRISELKKSAEANGLFCSNIILKNYNFEFTASDNSDSLKILLYFGKKGLKTVVQGKQESRLYENVLATTGLQQELFPTPNNEPNQLSFSEYIGSDESGKGDFFGPLVTAAFYCDKDTEKEINALGVKDSKTLSEMQIGRIAYLLERDFSGYCAISVLLPEVYNNIYKLIPNINTILSNEHSKVIQKLFDKVGKKDVIIDQFSVRTEKMKQTLGGNLNFTTKAERYPAVAAASILARNKFNEWFEHDPAISLALPKGASKQVENHAREIKKTFGLDIFDEIAKIHFSTYNKIQ